MDEILSTLEAHIQKGHFTHYEMVCGSLDGEKNRVREAFLPGGRVFFDLASLTKALVTAPLVHRVLAERGLSLDVPVAQLGVFPAFPSQVLRSTARQLLEHEAGLPFWRNLWLGTLTPRGTEVGAARERLHRSVAETSGTLGAFCYDDLGYMYLAFLLERLTGASLPTLFSSLLLSLGLSRSLLSFGPLASPSSHYIPTAYCRIRNRWLCGEAHDENAAALGGYSGHAGLFGSGEAVEAFLQRYLSLPEAAVFCGGGDPTQNAQKRNVCGWQAGMGLCDTPEASRLILGHQGFTGGLFWWEPATKFYGIFLTNRTMGGRQVSWIGELRRQVFRAQYLLLQRGGQV